MTTTIDIIYEDNHLLVMNKPPGLVTQPTEHHDESLEDLGKAWIKDAYNKPGAVFLEAVHRLDKAVSGVVLFARTSKALSRLNASQRARETDKHYLALVGGRLPDVEGDLVHYLRHGNFQAELADRPSNGAKEARLHYKCVRERAGTTLLEILLETGRYHQIRAQLAAVQCPILGDTRYGSFDKWRPDGIALHHHRLTVEHPTRKEPMTFEAPCPDDWPLGPRR